MVENPITLFREWLEEASKTEINDPEVMALATADKDGKPSVRMILLKQADERGFKFHTNYESKKGNHLDDNPYGALCFHWKTLRKQVRVEGHIEKISTEETEEYFAGRPYARQIGAWASQQSRPLESREHLEQRVQALQEQYPEDQQVPRPPHWGGYRLIPNRIEFWWDNPDRLHDRMSYTKNDADGWDVTRLYP